MKLTDDTGHSVEITIDELRSINAALTLAVNGLRKLAADPKNANRRAAVLEHTDELDALNMRLASLPR